MGGVGVRLGLMFLMHTLKYEYDCLIGSHNVSRSGTWCLDGGFRGSDSSTGMDAFGSEEDKATVEISRHSQDQKVPRGSGDKELKERRAIRGGNDAPWT